jgi:3-hydroxyisobutyrate dehydrogenase
VLLAANGEAEGLAPGSVVILTSTFGTEAIPATVEQLAGYGISLVDAPLLGGPVRAGEGDLLIIVGAEPVVLGQARPLLELLSSTLTVVGDKPGDVQATKTVNQLLRGVHIAAAVEALALDQAKTLAASSWRRRLVQAVQQRPASSPGLRGEGFRGVKRPRRLRQRLGHRRQGHPCSRASAPLAAAAEQLYLLGQAQGLGAVDDSAVIRVVAPRAHGRARGGIA